MLNNRPYRYQPLFGFQGTVLQWIFVVNLSVFILQAVFNHWLHTPVLETTFALSTENIRRGFLWTPVTYAVLHAGLIHLLINSLLIYLFGRGLQPFIGERNFFRLYVVSILGGGLVYLFFHLTGDSFVIGASAGLAGLISVFCLFHYEQKITFYIYFILPISLKGKYILWGFIALDLFGLLFSELPSSGGPSGVAHSSHLGGVFAGWLFFKYGLNDSDDSATSPLAPFSHWLKQKKQQRTAEAFKYQVNVTDRKELKKETDRILDKINAHGFASLTTEERRVLDRMQEMMRR